MNHACCAVYKRSGQNGLQCSLQSNPHSEFCVIFCNMHAGAALVIRTNLVPWNLLYRTYHTYLPLILLDLPRFLFANLRVCMVRTYRAGTRVWSAERSLDPLPRPRPRAVGAVTEEDRRSRRKDDDGREGGEGVIVVRSGGGRRRRFIRPSLSLLSSSRQRAVVIARGARGGANSSQIYATCSSFGSFFNQE